MYIFFAVYFPFQSVVTCIEEVRYGDLLFYFFKASTRYNAQIYCKMRTSNDYFMHTHSLPVYRKMLNSAGFSKVNEYHPWPTYRNPIEFVELETYSIKMHLREKARLEPVISRKWMYIQLLKLVSALDKQGLFCHSFSFIYKKS